jgi:hypothetical protein
MAMKKLTSYRLPSRLAGGFIMLRRGQPVVETRIKIPLIFLHAILSFQNSWLSGIAVPLSHRPSPRD